MYIVCKKCNAVLRRDRSEPRFDDAIYIEPCKCILEEINIDARKLSEKILGIEEDGI